MPQLTNQSMNAFLEYVNPMYTENESRWGICRDIVAGEDVVKSKNDDYLPIPSGMNTDEYYSYRDRAAFVAFAARAKEAMRGLVFRKRPLLVAPEELVKLSKDITTTGLSIDQLASFVLSEVLEVGRGGLLVEYPTNTDPAATLQDVDDMGLRPYLAYYKAEDILDWREGRVQNKKVLTYVKLREVYHEPSRTNPYTSDEVRRIRILRLDEEGYCEFEVWETRMPYSGVSENYINMLLPSEIPEYERINFADSRVYQDGEPIRYIPFVMLGPVENSPEIQKPPLMDMVWLNIHHYQASADRNHAIHYADCPTPIFFGQLISNDGTEVHTVKLGPTSAINIESGGDAKFLEMQGNGITPTRELMEEYVIQMSILGNKILATDSRAAEAAETAAIHRAGEQAILATMANTLSDGFTTALKMMAKWLGIALEDDDETEENHIYYHLSTDYLPTPMDSQTLIALIGAVTAGKMSDEEFYEALVGGELVRADKTYAQHKAEVEAMPPQAVPVADSGNDYGQPDRGVRNAQTAFGKVKGVEDEDEKEKGQGR